MSPKYHLLDLPDEVLLSVAIKFSLSDLLSFMHSCRRLSVMIGQSPLMQYLIRVMRNGLYDPLITDMSIPQRIEALETWESTWLELSLRGPTHRYQLSTIDLEDNPKRCRVQNGILIGSRLDRFRLSGSYCYLDFSHLLGQSSVVSRIDIPNVVGNLVQSWTYFPESDLVAIIFQSVPVFLSSDYRVPIIDGAYRRRGPPEFHFYQFSTGNKHPSAANYRLKLDLSTARASCVDCCGENMVAVVLDGEDMEGRTDDYIFLVEWKIGRITQVSSFTNQRHLCLDSKISCKRCMLERMVLWSPFCPAIPSLLPYETPSRFKFTN